MKAIVRAVAVLLVLACAGHGVPAAAADYLVLSLVDYQLTVITADRAADRSQMAVYPRSDGAFDLTALRAAYAAIGRARPGADVGLLRTTDARIYALQKKWIDGEAIDVRQLVDLLKGELASEPGARLVLIVARAADIMLTGPTAGDWGSWMSGHASGLGFYVELNAKMPPDGSAAPPSGFVAPFANFRMLLIDPRAMSVQADVAAKVGTVSSAARPTSSLDPWTAITDRARIQMLNSLITVEVDRMTPLLLSGRKP